MGRAASDIHTHPRIRRSLRHQRPGPLPSGPSLVTRLVRKADNWKVWVGIAYFGLALTIVWLFFLNQNQARVSAHQARDEAVRTAEADTAAVAQRTQCLASRPA